MLYASLKALHLLAVVAWVGGMFFTLACLRPAASVLEPPSRVTLMHAVLRRFFVVVTVALLIALATGLAMIALARATALRAGLAFNMPLDWYAMVGIFVVMTVVFAHIRLVLFRRLDSAVAAKRWADGGSALAAIRWEVAVNLVLGAFVVVFTRLGGTA